MMPRGRPPLRPDQRRPRRSGPSGVARAATPDEAAAQIAALGELRALVGAELYERRLAGPEPCAWPVLSEIVGVSASRLSRVARGDVPARPETLARWKRAVLVWMSGEDVAVRLDY